MSDKKQCKGKKSKSKSETHDVQLSKSLSWILRHGATKEGFILDENGYLFVDELLKHKNFRRYSVSDIEKVVADNNKQRFSLRIDPSTNRLQIKANQGHSIEVENLQLVPIEDAKSEPLVIHGTYNKYLEKIKCEGLSKMKRNHIHFSSAFPSDEATVSGIRKSCDVFIVIDLQQALNDGFKFYKSENGVILTPGNDAGFLPPIYFSKIIMKKDLKEH